MLRHDTIAAISTPPGEGAIGIVRLSGPDVLDISRRVFDRPLRDRRAVFGRIRDEHPALKSTDAQTQKMRVSVLRGMAQIIEALNLVRNEKTLAHPNPLLDEPEAMLAINAHSYAHLRLSPESRPVRA